MSNKERINAVTEQLKSMQAKVFQKSQGENGEYYKGLLDGTLTEFSAPKAGVTTIAPYRFYNFSNLKKADFTGVTEIPDYCCDGCNLQELVIDPNTTKIGTNAMRLKTSSTEFAKRIDLVFNPNNNVSIGSSAFLRLGVSSYSKYYLIKGLKGNFSNIGSNAFSASGSIALAIQGLDAIDILVNGRIDAWAFRRNLSTSDFKLNKISNVTYLGAGSFEQFGCVRDTPNTNIFIFDFRNSTFTSVTSNCFRGNSTQKSSYFDIYLPSTCTTIDTDCYQYSDHYNIYYKNVPTLNNTNNFTNATNYKNFFPYDQVKDAKVATNWSSTTNGVVDSIYGWAEENTFTQGQTLPTTDSAGNTLTWYSDVNLTIPVTTAENPEQIYYCSWTEKVS